MRNNAKQAKVNLPRIESPSKLSAGQGRPNPRDKTRYLGNQNDHLDNITNTTGDRDVLHIEDYDAKQDADFVANKLEPYLNDLYKDLLLRSNQEQFIDKVNFTEYLSLPGIINDRLHIMFSEAHWKKVHGKPSEPQNAPPSTDPKAKVEDYVTKVSFIKNFTTIFIGDLDAKMKFTFDMYDFDDDGFITPEDIRIMMSYMPFNRNVQIQNVQNMIDTRGYDNLSSYSNSRLGSPTGRLNSRLKERHRQKEGLYQEEDGKNTNFKDRQADQEEIKQFTDHIFKSGVAGISFNKMNYKQFEYVNKTVSSEMFYSLMAILHMQLPCAGNFFRLKKQYRDLNRDNNASNSPIRTIASPKMIRGLSITKKSKNEKDSDFSGSPRSVDIRIKGGTSRRQSVQSKLSSQLGSPLSNFGSPGTQIPGQKGIINRFKNPSLHETFGDASKEFEGAQSPHSMIQISKMRKYDMQKTSQNFGDVHQELQRQFSPITSQKTLGVRQKLTQVQPKIGGMRNNAGALGGSPNEGQRSIMSASFVTTQEEEKHRDDFSVSNDTSNAPLQGFGEIEAHMDAVTEGVCYLKTKTDRYKEHWAVLAGKELFCYRQKGDSEARVMHSMVGTFIKELPKEVSQSMGCDLYPVKIVLPPNKSRILYFKEESVAKDWYKRFAANIDYSNMSDFYNLEGDLGKGQFGLVKLATHTKTGQKVAIKTVNKKDMKPIEIYQQRREIDVLKMSQHPNIVALVDLFENVDYYYIVLEYMQGKDLFDYIEFRKFKLSETRVKQLAYQIGIALKYLHSYGIVHRDIKLENVMMTDNTENGIPKLVDFGLAKMIGPNEKANEPFGTLGYVAPEVLRKEPYSFSCDLWSWGCIIYALLSGSLPFDSESQKETIQMTLKNKLDFDQPCWAAISKECKDLVTSLLIKEPLKRITLENALKHPWFMDLEINPDTGLLKGAAAQALKMKKFNLQ